MLNPFANREDFDDDFRIISISRSWLTFEIENIEIKNAENGFFSKCSLINALYIPQKAVSNKLLKNH